MKNFPKVSKAEVPTYTDPVDLQKRVDTYFKSCWEEEVVLDNEGAPIVKADGKPFVRKTMFKPYTMTGLALFLGVTRQRLVSYNWGSQGEEVRYIISVARERVQEFVESKLLTKGENVIGSIFHLKNNFAWKDTIEQEIRSTVQIEKAKDLFGEVLEVEGMDAYSAVPISQMPLVEEGEIIEK